MNRNLPHLIPITGDIFMCFVVSRIVFLCKDFAFAFLWFRS